MLETGHVLAGVAVVLAVEGLCYAAFPGAMKRMLTSLSTLPEQRLRQGGIIAACIAVLAAWIIIGI
jgi:hypothetical protein